MDNPALQYERLSRREKEIATAFSGGENHHQIAERLCIAPSTVRTHLASIYRKLEVSSKLELHRLLEGGGPTYGSSDTTLPIISDRPSIAVLPFANMSDDPGQDYFAEGIAEDIITALSRIKWFFVTSKLSSFSYEGRAVDVKQIGAELGVRYVLEGSVRKSGLRVRVTAQLVDSSNGTHVWAERYDREISDIFDIQDEITRNVVASTQTQVVLAEASLFAGLEKPSLPVWALVNRSWKLMYDMTAASLLEGRRLAEEAIALDPGSGRAHQVLAAHFWHSYWMGFADDRRKTLEAGRKAAERAIRLNEYDEYSHWLLGLHQLADRNFDMAVAELERAIEINPNCSLAYGSLATVLNFAGQPEAAITNNLIAVRSNPRDPSIFYRHTGLALSHFLINDFDAAVGWARKSVLFKPDWFQGHVVLIAALVESGQLTAAETAFGDYLRSFPEASCDDVLGMPFKDREPGQRLVKSLKKVGLRG